MSAFFGERIIFGQHADEDIELVVWGDEFYSRFETADGFTVVYDTEVGAYCFARLYDGRLLSTQVPTSKPPPLGIRRHIRERADVRNSKFDARFEALRPPDPDLQSEVSRTLGPNDGLLTGRRVSDGNVKGPAILVEFDDIRTTITSNDVDSMLNDEAFAGHGNLGSVRRYFQLMSSEKLDYTNVVVGPVRFATTSQPLHRQSPDRRRALAGDRPIRRGPVSVRLARPGSGGRAECALRRSYAVLG